MAFVTHHELTISPEEQKARLAEGARLAKGEKSAKEEFEYVPPPTKQPHYYLKSPVKLTNPQGDVQLAAGTEVQFVGKEGIFYTVKSGQYRFQLRASQLDIKVP